MKSKRITKCQSKDEERLIIDPPYTIIGQTRLPQSYCLTMKVGGLKEMLKDLEGEDTFRIEVFADKATEYSFICDKPTLKGD